MMDDADATDDLKVICSWCGRVIRHGTRQVSHGICGDCARRVWEIKRDDQLQFSLAVVAIVFLLAAGAAGFGVVWMIIRWLAAA